MGCAALLCYGADLAIEAANGETPLQTAERKHGYRSRIACFLRAPPEPDILDEEAQVGGGAALMSRPRSRSVPAGLSAREMADLETRLRRERIAQPLRTPRGRGDR